MSTNLDIFYDHKWNDIKFKYNLTCLYKHNQNEIFRIYVNKLSDKNNKIKIICCYTPPNVAYVDCDLIDYISYLEVVNNVAYLLNKTSEEVMKYCIGYLIPFDYAE